jgi:cellulose synthase operon protein C
MKLTSTRCLSWALSLCALCAPKASALASSAAPRAALPAALAALDPAAAVQGSDDDAALIAEERRECDRLRRRGEARTAERRLTEILDEDKTDAESFVLRARCRVDQTQLAQALQDVHAASAILAAPEKSAAPGAAPGPTGAGENAAEARAENRRRLGALTLRTEADILSLMGRSSEAVALLDKAAKSLAPALDARDAWSLGRALWQAGQRERARVVLGQGSECGDDQPWDGLWARGECQRRLGRLEAASQSFVRSLEVSKAVDGDEPDVLAALGSLYFEADKEVEAAKGRSAANLFRDALKLDPVHEGALLGLHALHRYNWQRQRESAQSILGRALAARPESIETLLVAVAVDIDDGQLKSARERLAKLESIAGGRREVKTLRATLDWIEHKEEACAAILGELEKEDPLDATPEREVGRHLLELYRFAEGLPFVKRACERDPTDWDALTQLGRALANTGDEVGARDALDRAQKAAAGRQDAWRDNMRLALKRIGEKHERAEKGDLTFSWEPEGGAVLATYLIPFYENARAELAKRYGFTPQPTTIEVFRQHKDFSVRSTGFEGFPALGVCFGPVVTAVSPLSEMRGTQSWARTSFHEFTHVIHLGLSHNRCPRWITEGLATWEEVNRNPTWTRNMRRELVDSIANGDVIPVREINRAFRGPRILFGYYQGGLICQMLIERDGFAPIVRLLEAFDRGLDLDQALAEVYKTTPEALDRDFAAFVAHETAGLRIEPRWNPSRVERIRLALARTMPSDAKKRAEWIDGWCTVAWSAWQQHQKIDAQEALRQIKDVDPPPPRSLFLRGEIALTDGDATLAAKLWKQAIDQGADDYRVRIALGAFARDANDEGEMEAQYKAAEKVFPGYDDHDLSAELRLAALYDKEKRVDDAMLARERWLRWNAGEVKARLTVAKWRLEKGDTDIALALYDQANEVDPFLRSLHRAWGDALRAANRHAEALREYEMTLAVPPALDAEKQEPYTDVERAEVLGLQAASLLSLGRNSEALAKAKEALALDGDCAIAKETLQKVQ